MNLQSYSRGKRMLAGLMAVVPLALTSATVAAQTNLSPSASGGGVWYAIPAAFLLGVLAALAIYSRLQKRRKPVVARPSQPGVEAPGFYAYLVQQGDGNVQHEVKHTPCRIGRSSDRNDITLKHPSISRLHAQITMRKDGVYEITDMESLNGVFLNDRKVKNAALAEGDVIDIGDLTFKFTSSLE